MRAVERRTASSSRQDVSQKKFEELTLFQTLLSLFTRLHVYILSSRTDVLRGAFFDGC